MTPSLKQRIEASFEACEEPMSSPRTMSRMGGSAAVPARGGGPRQGGDGEEGEREMWAPFGHGRHHAAVGPGGGSLPGRWAKVTIAP